ncbi:hypothetical protein [Peristeroidobacter agariperforans]|uniref:hypothetical protein n=1 Tax=Peristeroidobacter agariperforans TaxID=268404 RepID=UPI00101C8AEF|nr:hypothetical protein [Peristeroidobacter agariperforans]
MLQRFYNDVVLALGHGCGSSHLAGWRRCRPALTIICGLTLGLSCKVHAQQPADAADNANKLPVASACLPDGSGYLKARLSGAVQTELVWGNDGTECTGAVRPDGGIRVRFSHKDGVDGGRLVLLFGIAALREGQSAKALPVNLTVIREGLGEFYSTQGDNKCTLDDVRQEPLVGIPHRSRSYRIIARGFCTHPARAVRGNGVILLSRFDYVGRIDFDAEDKDETLAGGAMTAQGRMKQQ